MPCIRSTASRRTSATSLRRTRRSSGSAAPRRSIAARGAHSAMRNSSERKARRHYRLRGYRILGTNVWIGGYEIDLVVRRGRALVFCEVKGKSGDGYGDPLEMVTAEK